jgi:hypothetical protein
VTDRLPLRWSILAIAAFAVVAWVGVILLAAWAFSAGSVFVR